eukprot:TRINITY_DN2632_c0_g1_i2.p1 TRINITY_DN2632_c0_g1~~TRINITY_DN2632_c0_g1_i2.p1  ORF type:complete len:762 (-),score=175.96 TRINITY_DN2632_c0_g1_i2:718-3003(-)
MSGWSIDEIENIAWDRFSQSEDEMITDSSNADQWGADGKQWQNLYPEAYGLSSKEEEGVTRASNVISEGKVASLSSSTGDGASSPLPLDMWSVLDDGDFSKTTFNPICFGTDIDIDNEKPDETHCKDVKLEPKKQDSVLENCTGNVSLDEKETALNSPCHFMEGEHRDYMSKNMLDYSFEGIADFEEVDKLFQNSESNMEQPPETDAEVSWDNYTRVSVDDTKNIQSVMPSSNKDSRKCKRSPEMNDIMNNLMSDKYPSLVYEKHDIGAQDATTTNKKQKEDPTNDINLSAKYSKEESGVLQNRQVELGTRSRTLGLIETNSKTKSPKATASLGSMDSYSYSQNKQSSHSDFRPSKPPNLQGIPSSENSLLKLESEGYDNIMSNMQSNVPYFSTASKDHVNDMVLMPPLSSTLPQAQQSFKGFGDNQMPTGSSDLHHTTEQPFDITVKHPLRVPQDKVEELRWNQKMHNMVKVEAKQQNFAMDSSLSFKDIQSPLQWNDRLKSQDQIDGMPSGLETKLLEDKFINYGSYINREVGTEAAILQELQSYVSQMDIQTRLCIRDALYRLARSAVQRHSVGDANVNNSFGDYNIKNHSQGGRSDYQLGPDSCMGNASLEKGTNIIDRTVAHLLFHRSAVPSSEANLNTNEFPRQSTSVNPQVEESLPSSLWHPSSGSSSASSETNRLAVMQIPRQQQIPTSIPDYYAETLNQSVRSSFQGSCSLSSAASSLRGCNNSTSTSKGQQACGFDSRSLLKHHSAKNDRC